MSTATLDEDMPKDPGFSSNVTGTDASGGGTLDVPGETFVGDPMPDPNGTPCIPNPAVGQPEQITVNPGPNPAIHILDGSGGMKFGMADGNMPMKGKWDNGITLDDTELCGKTPEELLELIKQMREIELMLDPILLKLIEDVAFAPQFDKMKKFRETNLEMLRLSMNIFNKKVESKYDLAPAAGKK